MGGSRSTDFFYNLIAAKMMDGLNPQQQNEGHHSQLEGCYWQLTLVEDDLTSNHIQPVADILG